MQLGHYLLICVASAIFYQGVNSVSPRGSTCGTTTKFQSVRQPQLNAGGRKQASVIRQVYFVCEGEKATSACPRYIFMQLKGGR